jgi:hypothetical protein
LATGRKKPTQRRHHAPRDEAHHAERDAYTNSCLSPYDEYGARTKIVHRTFLIVTGLGSLLGMVLTGLDDLTLENLLLWAVASALAALFVTASVGAVLAPFDEDSVEDLWPEDVLRNRRERWQQESAQLDLPPAEPDQVIDDTSSPRSESPAVDPSQTTIQPKEPHP